MDKFQNKYRITTTRAQWWDYSSNASYFVTICTQNRIHYFGEIKNQKMIFNKIGTYAETCWFDIPNHFPFVKLGAFVVMPNHIHGIIIIVDSRLIANLQSEPTISESYPQSEPTKIEPPKTGGATGNKNPMLNDNLSRVIRWYKGRCSFEMRKFNPHFKWQSRFHEHIIRNEMAYQRISYYIENNPKNWKLDTFTSNEI